TTHRPCNDATTHRQPPPPLAPLVEMRGTPAAPAWGGCAAGVPPTGPAPPAGAPAGRAPRADPVGASRRNSHPCGPLHTADTAGAPGYLGLNQAHFLMGPFWEWTILDGAGRGQRRDFLRRRAGGEERGDRSRAGVTVPGGTVARRLPRPGQAP